MATFVLDGEIVIIVSGELVRVVGPVELLNSTGIVELFTGKNHYHKLATYVNSENHEILEWLELEQTLKLT